MSLVSARRKQSCTAFALFSAPGLLGPVPLAATFSSASFAASLFDLVAGSLAATAFGLEPLPPSSFAFALCPDRCFLFVCALLTFKSPFALPFAAFGFAFALSVAFGCGFGLLAAFGFDSFFPAPAAAFGLGLDFAAVCFSSFGVCCDCDSGSLGFSFDDFELIVLFIRLIRCLGVVGVPSGKLVMYFLASAMLSLSSSSVAGIVVCELSPAMDLILTTELSRD